MNSNKDLLILPKQQNLSAEELKKEVDFICRILYSDKCTKDFLSSNEIFNINNHKTYRTPVLVQNYIKIVTTSFVFLINKN
jgi:hypothetical protein